MCFGDLARQSPVPGDPTITADCSTETRSSALSLSVCESLPAESLSASAPLAAFFTCLRVMMTNQIVATSTSSSKESGIHAGVPTWVPMGLY